MLIHKGPALEARTGGYVDLLFFSCGWKREGSPRVVIASGCEPGLWLAVALGCPPPESEASGALKKSSC